MQRGESTRGMGGPVSRSSRVKFAKDREALLCFSSDQQSQTRWCDQRSGEAMDCPRCYRETITYREWCQGLNAFRWKCPHCQVALKATGWVWLCFVAAILLAGAVLAGVIALDIEGYFPKGGLAKLLVAVGCFLEGIFMATMAWSFGGYRVHE